MKRYNHLMQEVPNGVWMTYSDHEKNIRWLMEIIAEQGELLNEIYETRKGIDDSPYMEKIRKQLDGNLKEIAKAKIKELQSSSIITTTEE